MASEIRNIDDEGLQGFAGVRHDGSRVVGLCVTDYGGGVYPVVSGKTDIPIVSRKRCRRKVTESK